MQVVTRGVRAARVYLCFALPRWLGSWLGRAASVRVCQTSATGAKTYQLLWVLALTAAVGRHWVPLQNSGLQQSPLLAQQQPSSTGTTVIQADGVAFRHL